MTIADLERIIELAGRMASSSGKPITDEIVEEAFERMRMGETRTVPDESSLLRTARHEAGHCLIGWLRGDKPVQVTIVARGNAGGFVEREAEEDRTRYVRPELEGMIRQALGGRAAEMVYYGDEEGLSSGASADLRAATHWAELMARDFGMSDGFGHIYIDSKRIADGPLAVRVLEEVRKITSVQLDRAR
jgi:ATP-dependent Zn protease